MQSNIFTCYLCSPPFDLKEHQIQGHCIRVHKTPASLKCCKCDFLGPKHDIIAHYKKEHPEGKSHGILQVFVTFVKSKREVHPNRENIVSSENNQANGAISKPVPSSSGAVSKQPSKLSIQNSLGSKKSLLVPTKKPNLMINLKKKAVILGFSSWKQEEVRNQAQSRKTIEPRLPATSSASSLLPSSKSSVTQHKIVQKKKIFNPNKLDPHSNNNSVKKYREPNGGMLTKKQKHHKSFKRKIRRQQAQSKQTHEASERVNNKEREIISEFDADTEGGTESGSQSESERETESRCESSNGSESESQTGTETETKSKIKAAIKDKAKAKSKAKVESKGKAKADPIIYELSSSPDAESEPEPEPEPEPEDEDVDESLETTIGLDSNVFPYLSSKNENDRSSSIYFCIFCDKKYTKFNLALHHMRVHVNFGYHCKYDKYFHLLPSCVQRHIRKEHRGQPEEYKDDHFERRNVNSWIIDFLNEQFNNVRLVEEDQVIDKPIPWVQCPICVKVARCKKKFAHKFTSFRAFERHYWQHTRWWRVDCVLCGASVQRAHQRDHLSEHEIHMKDDNLEIFEVYFHERIDEMTSNKLEYILDNVEKEFYARYKWYRDIKRDLNIKLVPCDSELPSSISKKGPETAEKSEPENDKETKTIKAITNEERSFRKATESRNNDELSSYSDIESEEAMKLAMKILNGGNSPESDHSSIENDSPLNEELAEAADVQTSPDENKQSIEDKQAPNPDKSDAAIGVIVNDKEREKDSPRKENQLVEISPNLQTKNQEVCDRC
uniref:C2H2-type domain-containing protein n=1 Tax=Tetranychus urticae TaxID=32264 RepID=T1KEN3_TETUR